MEITGYDEEHLMRRVARSLAAWDPQALDCLEDCKIFYDRTINVLASAGTEDTHHAQADALGSWIIWNILGRAPSGPDEKSLMRSVGMLTVGSFLDWWDGKPASGEMPD